MRVVLAAAAALLLAGCGLTTVVQPDPGGVPGVEPQPMRGGPAPIGPVTVLGSGRLRGVEWRYVGYESTEGLCTQLELGASASGGCGPIPAFDDSVFGGIGSGSSTGDLTWIQGIVADEVASVVVMLKDGRRETAVLMSMRRLGLDAQAFVAVAQLPVRQRGSDLETVVALDAEGRVMETFELER